MDSLLIKQKLENIFPQETNLVGEKSLDIIVSTATEKKELQIETTRKGDQLNYYEVAHILLEAATFILALWEFSKDQKPADDLTAEDILTIVDSPGFSRLSPEKKLQIIRKLVK